MLAKMTSKNQLTLPKAITTAVGPVEYFDVQTKDGVIILTTRGADVANGRLAPLRAGWQRQAFTRGERSNPLSHHHAGTAPERDCHPKGIEVRALHRLYIGAHPLAHLGIGQTAVERADVLCHVRGL